MGWEVRKRRGGGREGEGRGKGKGGEGPGRWSAPGPVLALGGPGGREGEEKREGKGTVIKTPPLKWAGYGPASNSETQRVCRLCTYGFSLGLHFVARQNLELGVFGVVVLHVNLVHARHITSRYLNRTAVPARRTQCLIQ